MTEHSLIAHTGRLGPAFDLLAAYHPGGFFFERSGLGVAGSGVAETLDAGAGPGRIFRLSGMVREALALVKHDPDGPTPVAVAAIPFADSAPARATIPARAAVRHAPGDTWQIDVAVDGLVPFDDVRERWTGARSPHEAFDEMQLWPLPEPDDYAALVDRATQRIRAGELRKIVLARALLVNADRELDPKQLLWRLRAVDPDCYAFATPADPDPPRGVLVGASPELLLRKRGRLIEATPLAGSAPRYGDSARDRASSAALFRSAKDQEEHAVVVDDVRRVLAAFCDRLEHPPEPDVLGTANVWHLATPFRGRLHDAATGVLDVVAAMHPTPAVCGTPRDVASEALGELERIDRGAYAGPVGWVDADGDGEWAIALRCAEITGKTARLFAGAGIVADSVPEAEVDETDRKFRALLDALRWG
ncbi:MAG TPA: isochorismate synthase [Actinomycetota bacterium]